MSLDVSNSSNSVAEKVKTKMIYLVFENWEPLLLGSTFICQTFIENGPRCNSQRRLGRLLCGFETSAWLWLKLNWLSVGIWICLTLEVCFSTYTFWLSNYPLAQLGYWFLGRASVSHFNNLLSWRSWVWHCMHWRWLMLLLKWTSVFFIYFWRLVPWIDYTQYVLSCIRFCLFCTRAINFVQLLVKKVLSYLCLVISSFPLL